MDKTFAQATTADEMLTLHEDAFYAFFRPYRHAQASCDIWGGIGLETFGDDLALVKSLPATQLWTVVDGDDGDQWILPGVHAVNRVCYLMTEIPHNWREVQFRIPQRGYALTPIGLKRQVNKLSVTRCFAAEGAQPSDRNHGRNRAEEDRVQCNMRQS